MKNTYLILSLFMIMPFKSVAYKQSPPRHILQVNMGNRQVIRIARAYQDGFAQPDPDNQPDDLIFPAAPNVVDDARDIDGQLGPINERMPSLCGILCPIITGVGIILIIQQLIG